MKYCEGLDCEICNEKEPCIYRRANELQQCLNEIEEICKCSKEGCCDNCPIREHCEELCINDNNLQDYILEKIKEVKGE